MIWIIKYNLFSDYHIVKNTQFNEILQTEFIRLLKDSSDKKTHEVFRKVHLHQNVQFKQSFELSKRNPDSL